MKHHDFQQHSAKRRERSKAATVTCLIVPGLDGSGPGHWQTLWESSRDDCRRVDLASWNDPHLDAWCDGLGRAVSAAVGPVVLAAHGLGCFAIAWWAASADQFLIAKVRAALAQDVAPPSMRATAAALLIAIVSLVGYGIGPPMVGFLSDVLGQVAMAAHGTTAEACAGFASPACSAASADGLRLSLSLGSSGFIFAALLFALSGRTIERDMHR